MNVGYKMKSILIGIILVSVCLNAEITSESTLFSSLCIEDDSTGFSWRNGKWKQTNFYTKKYFYKKVKSQAHCSSTKVNKDNKDDKYMLVQWVQGCYEVGEFGSKYRRIIECDEFWNLYPNGNIKLNWIRCPNIGFQPDGNFARSNHYTQLNDFNEVLRKKEKFKDDLFVSHGKCSKL